jgi:Sulfotransferase domain
MEATLGQRVGIAIVGAPKCATTSMLRYLGQHPLLHDHPQAECDYFLNPVEYERGWEIAHSRYYPRDPGPPVQLVAKRAVMLYDVDSLSRLAEHNPDAVVTAMLRNPVDRAHSAYGYARLRGWQAPESFEAAIATELADGPFERVDPHGPGGYLSSGVYVWHVRRLLEVFPRDQVHLFTTEEVAAAGDGGRVWRTLFTAVGVDPDFVPEHRVRHNVAASPRSERVAQLLASKTGLVGAARRLAPDWALDKARRLTTTVMDRREEREGLAWETRERLDSFFAPFNRELEDLLGRSVSWSRRAEGGSRH